MPRFRRPLLAVLLVTAALVPTGCATFQQVMALRNVDFAFDRVSNVRLAGVDVSRVRSFSDLSLGDAARLTAAVADRNLPLSLDVHLSALNPPDNSVDARLVRMDWTFLLEGREALSGVFADEILLPPGEPRTVPLSVGLNLVEFVDGSARELVDLALSIAGAGGSPAELAVLASPTVQTVLGPIRYPRPLTLVRTTVGQD